MARPLTASTAPRSRGLRAMGLLAAACAFLGGTSAALAGDPVPIDDSTSRAISVFTGQYTPPLVADAVSSEVSLTVGLYDPPVVADAVSRELSVYAGDLSPPPVTDAIAREISVFVGQYDGIAVTDAVSTEVSVFTGQYDAIAVVDAVSSEVSVFTGQYDLILVADAVSREISVSTGPVPSPPPDDAISLEWSIGVQGADLRILAVLPSAMAATDEPFTVSWFGRNSGTAPATGPWTDEVALSSDGTLDGVFAVVGSRTFFETLPPSTTYEASLDVNAPSVPGPVWVVVTADSGDAVNETGYDTGESNNAKVSDTSVAVVQSARPNLVVIGLTPPSSAPPGATVQVAWNTANQGSAAAVGPWTETVHLSDDDIVGDDTLLGTFTVSAIIPPGGSLARLASVTMPPDLLPGQYWIVVRTNAGDEVIELPGNADTAIVEICADCLLPDLIASNLTGPAAIDAGALLTADWAVANDGDGPADPPWLERLILVPEAPTTGDPVILGDVTTDTPVPNGDPPVARTGTFGVPYDLEGTYRLQAIVDADNDVYEPGGEGNNVVDAADVLTITQPPLPDLRVVSAGAATEAETGSIVEIAWTVTNEGETTAAAPWADRVYLHTSPVFDPATAELRATVTRNASVSAGGTYAEPVIRQVVMPPAPGLIYLTVVTDALANVEEGIDELDNAFTLAPVAVVYPPRPNLRPQDLVPAPRAPIGTLVDVSWTVVNDGETDLTGAAWNERIYASSNQTIGGDILLATLAFNEPLPLGVPVTRTQSVPVPDLPNGWYLVVDIDSGNVIFETNESDNRAIAATPSAVLLPNLIPAITLAPTSGVADDAATITWQVTNTGVAPAGGSWLDTVFIQPVNGSAGPQALGSQVRNGGLGIGGQYVASITASLPPYALGEYRLFVVADVSGALTEGDEFDNESVGQFISITQPARANLVPTQVTPPSDGLVGRPLQLTYRLENIGRASVDGAFTPFTDRVIAIDIATGIERPLGLFTVTGAIPFGDFLDVTIDAAYPDIPGTYRLAVVTDVANAINEGPSGGENDNRLDDAATFASDVYEVTVSTDFEEAAMPIAAPITITGSAALSRSGLPLANVQVAVAVDSQGTRRILPAVTDAKGLFAVNFTPLINEAGSYTLRAGPPGLVTATAQDTFILHGMRREGFGSVTVFTTGSEVVDFFSLRNNGDGPLTGLTWTDPDPVPGVTLTIEPKTLDIAGNDRAVVTVRATAAPEATEFGVYERTVSFETAEGATATVPVFVDLRPPTATLVSNPSSLSAGVVLPPPGSSAQTLLEFELTNLGSGTAEDIQVLVPTIPWVSVATDDTVSALGPGESAQVVLILEPDADVAIGPYTGSIAVTGGAQTLNIPFTFTLTLDGEGDLEVSCTDEGTYYSSDDGTPLVDGPLVPGALVTVRDHFTGVILGEIETDATGIALFESLPAGYIDVQTVADGHISYSNTFLVTPGGFVEVEAFMPISAVTYEWVVIPTYIEDEYVITIEAVYETFVPAPVLVIEPTYVDVSDLPGDGPWDYVFTVTNEGLVAASNVVFNGDEESVIVAPIGGGGGGGGSGGYTLPIGDLGPGESVTVPVTITPCVDCDGSCNPARPQVCWELECGGFTYSYCTNAIVYDPDAADDCDTIPPPSNDVVNPPSPPQEPGEPGPPSYTGPPAVITQVNCNPCIFGCLEQLLLCVIDESCFTAGYKCGKAAFNSFSISSTVGCVMPGLKCAGFTTFKWLNLPKALRCPCKLFLACGIDCTDSPLAGNLSCSLTGLAAIGYDYALGLDDEGSPLSEPLDEPDLEYLRKHFLRSLSVSLSLWYPFGAEPFAEIEDDELELFDLWREALVLRMDETSDDGVRISATEAAELIGTPYPSNLTVQDLQTFFARWNRTADYYDAGIYVVADVPDGLSTDFIDAVLLDALWNAAWEAIEGATDEGFNSPFEALILAMTAVGDNRSQSEEGVCARVTLQLEQTATVTRSAFDASLLIENQSPDVLESLQAVVLVQTVDGLPADDLFDIQLVELSGIPTIDGSSNLPAVSECFARWQIVPSNDAAPDEPTDYRITGFFEYVRNGELLTTPLFPIVVEVQPNANLKFKYFLEKYVYADDPFTPDITEPTTPFSLGLVVTNQGNGSAFDLNIVSTEPKIIENEQDLLIDFQLIGSQVGADPVTPSFAVNLGDFDPGVTNVARWLMTSSLQGEFVAVEASLQNTNGLDDPEFWIIDPEIDVYFMQHVVRVDDASGGMPDDMKPDFLADEIPDLGGDFVPDRVHSSDGSVTPVTPILAAESVEILPGELLQARITVDVPADDSFHYVRILDPFAGQYPVTGVERADGKPIILGSNAWQTDRIHRSGPSLPVRRLHLFDRGGSGEYLVTFDADITAPAVTVWASLADYAGIGRIPLPIPSGGVQFTEPRLGGPESLRVAFTEPIDPETFTAAAVRLTVVADDGDGSFGGSTAVAWPPRDVAVAPITVSLLPGGLVGEIRFNLPIPDRTRVCLRLEGVRDLAGNELVTQSLAFGVLLGDLVESLEVDFGDLLAVAALDNQSIDPGDPVQVRADMNRDGRIDSDDIVVVEGTFEHEIRSIDEPCGLPAGPGGDATSERPFAASGTR